MTNRIALFGLLAVSLTLSAPLSAQRGASRGGGSHMAGGGSHMAPPHMGPPMGMSGGNRGVAARSSASASSFAPIYSGYYPSAYGFGMPFAYTSNPYPQDANGGPMVIVSSPPGQPELNVVYIPSYLRPDNGPSLGELAAQLKTRHQPSKYIWRNVEPLLQPK